METTTKIGIGAVAAILVISGWYEISLWNECRDTNSWYYCIRVLGR